MILVVLAAVAGLAAPEFARIDAALADGRTAVARRLIEHAPKEAVADELALRVAELALAEGRTDAAAAAFAVLAANPGLAALAFQGSALAAAQRGDDIAAGAALDRALGLDPALPRAWNLRAVLADRRADWPAAEAAYARALQLSPDEAVYHSNRGYSRLLQRRPADALVDLDAALRLAPGLPAALTNRRLALALAGNYDAAFAGASRRDIVRDLNIVGVGAMMRGDTAAARGYFTRAIEKNPEFDRIAWRNLAYLDRVAPRALPGAAAKEP